MEERRKGVGRVRGKKGRRKKRKGRRKAIWGRGQEVRFWNERK